MSNAIGPVGYTSDQPEYLGPGRIQDRSYAEATQRVIDEEVSRLLREAEVRALNLLRTHRDALDRLAELLLEKETVDGSEVDALVDRVRPASPERVPTPAFNSVKPDTIPR